MYLHASSSDKHLLPDWAPYGKFGTAQKYVLYVYVTNLRLSIENNAVYIPRQQMCFLLWDKET